VHCRRREEKMNFNDFFSNQEIVSPINYSKLTESNGLKIEFKDGGMVISVDEDWMSEFIIKTIKDYELSKLSIEDRYDKVVDSIRKSLENEKE
jgi:hypothetical protein